jgi:Domain of unknown function (DUF4173)
MISLEIAKPAIPFEIRAPLQCLGAAAGATALADWLFYLHRPGISVVIFAVTLGVVVLLMNPLRARRAEFVGAFVILTAALLPAIEDFGVLSLVFAVLGTALFALLATGWPARPGVERITDLVWMIVSGPFQFAADMGAVVRQAREGDAARHGASWLMAWVVPLGVGGVFVLLLAAANPVIESWFTSVDASGWNDIDPRRPVFWLVVAALTWPFLRVRLEGKPSIEDLLGMAEPPQPPHQPALPADHAPASPVAAALFGKTAILRSLLLFNALFVVQTALDIVYLWTGVALPGGMSYATYAHRGAYPLIVTALLAGAFVLAAMQPGSTTERSRLIRALVFLWIGQTVLLVLSSILRLDLYVDTYSLTEWRCAAFIWMLLVAVGLVLIVARIALDRPNAWLIWKNAAALALTLYVCSFVDFSGVIADFNVAHSQEMSGTGQPVDVNYLCGLGPAAIPAIDKLAPKMHAVGRITPSCRRSLAMIHHMRLEDWRAWSFRGFRLVRRLEQDDRKAATPAGPQGD